MWQGQDTIPVPPGRFATAILPLAKNSTTCSMFFGMDERSFVVISIDECGMGREERHGLRRNLSDERAEVLPGASQRGFAASPPVHTAAL